VFKNKKVDRFFIFFNLLKCDNFRLLFSFSLSQNISILVENILFICIILFTLILQILFFNTFVFDTFVFTIVYFVLFRLITRNYFIARELRSELSN